MITQEGMYTLYESSQNILIASFSMLKIGKAPMRTNVIISTSSRIDIILKGRHGGRNLAGFFVQCFKKKKIVNPSIHQNVMAVG